MTTAWAPLAGRRLVVTGATGFLGSAFVRNAVAAGAQVTILCRADANHWRLADVQGRVLIVKSALSELHGVELPVDPPAILVHFAAAGVNQSMDDVNGMVATNVVGTANVLELANRHAMSRVVIVGTSGEYGAGVHIAEDAPCRPTSVYGATRAGATLLARAFSTLRDLDVVVVRPFAVFGEYEASYRLIPHAILSALRGIPIRISSGHQTRDYVHVDDVSAGIASACAVAEARNGTFNLCTGHETSVRDAAALVARLVETGSAVETGAVPAIPGEMWRTSGDPSRAQDVLGWRPALTLEEGLHRTVAWFREFAPHYTEYAAR